MPQSLVQFYAHIVFSTKNRKPLLADAGERSQLHAYLAGACEGQRSPAINIGGTEDHVHILCRLSKSLDVVALVREIKRDSSKWLKHEFPALSEFAWQEGYGAFSLSPSHVEKVKAYIDNQMERHRRESFQDEFRRICAKYGVAIDERYAWD